MHKFVFVAFLCYPFVMITGARMWCGGPFCSSFVSTRIKNYKEYASQELTAWVSGCLQQGQRFLHQLSFLQQTSGVYTLGLQESLQLLRRHGHNLISVENDMYNISCALPFTMPETRCQPQLSCTTHPLAYLVTSFSGSTLSRNRRRSCISCGHVECCMPGYILNSTFLTPNFSSVPREACATGAGINGSALPCP
jgi:hypothetical protein